MEVIGDTSPEKAPFEKASPEKARPGDARPASVELDLDASGELDGKPDAKNGSSPLARLAAVFSGESFAIASIAMAVAAIVGGYFNPVIVIIITMYPSSDGPRAQVEQYAAGMAISATAAIALGIVGLLRLPPSGPAWARALASAGVLLAVLCFVVAAVAVWKATSLTPLPTT